MAERESSPGTYEIIDGLQRLNSIVSYIENRFPLQNGTYFHIDSFPTAKAAASDGSFKIESDKPQLSSKDVSTILDYTLALSVMRNATEDEINDVFDRINTYGHRLSDQERRQAGVQNEFSSMVRELACTLRGDSSATVLPLSSMPSISIDLPMSNHGYEVRADEVFWVNQGILRATDLRDSLDEQCIADIAACIVGNQIIERSKDALDTIYVKDSEESLRILDAMEVYGSSKLSDEIKYCISEILKVCEESPSVKLRQLIFGKKNTNAFPAVFAVLMIAVHELFFAGKKKFRDYSLARKALDNLSERIDTSRKSTSVEERRKNIDTIKGLLHSSLTDSDPKSLEIYGDHTAIDIESIIRRSEIELANYELKQGILALSEGGGIDGGILLKIVRTICGIANIGPKQSGKILIGVTDKDSDAARASSIDGVDPRKIGKRFVVGVHREAKRLNKSNEQYYSIIRDYIRKSDLSVELRDSVLSSMDFNSFYGLGVVVISIPPQKTLSYVGDELYWRNGDSTELAGGAKQIAGLANRFSS